MSFDFIKSEDTPQIARQLLGYHIISRIGKVETVGKIVETEAYRAPEDKASHAYNNKRTGRTEIMFGNAGLAYVYLCYGIHSMLNIVTGPQNNAHAVLIRALEPVSGLDHMIKRRGGIYNVNLSNGPGKLCKAMGILTAHNGTDLLTENPYIFLSPGSEKINNDDIISGARVGIAYAEECALWPWRFRIKNNKWTSLPHEPPYPDQ